jgi:hypothetical protein
MGTIGVINKLGETVRKAIGDDGTTIRVGVKLEGDLTIRVNGDGGIDGRGNDLSTEEGNGSGGIPEEGTWKNAVRIKGGEPGASDFRKKLRDELSFWSFGLLSKTFKELSTDGDTIGCIEGMKDDGDVVGTQKLDGVICGIGIEVDVKLTARTPWDTENITWMLIHTSHLEEALDLAEKSFLMGRGKDFPDSRERSKRDNTDWELGLADKREEHSTSDSFILSVGCFCVLGNIVALRGGKEGSKTPKCVCKDKTSIIDGDGSTEHLALGNKSSRWNVLRAILIRIEG